MSVKRTNRGFSLIELLVVVAIILIIAAIAIPTLMRSTMLAHEASAIGSLHALNTACVTYSSTYGSYPATLANLGPAASPSSAAADLIDSVLVSGAKSGYIFSYSAGPPTNTGISSYSITANPADRGVTGQRGFYTDQSLIIRYNETGTASATDPPIQ